MRVTVNWGYKKGRKRDLEAKTTHRRENLGEKQQWKKKGRPRGQEKRQWDREGEWGATFCNVVKGRGTGRRGGLLRNPGRGKG